jgi:hypothetical protein
MKMSQREKVTVTSAFFAAWGVVFFGVWQVYVMPDFYKVVADAVDSVVFVFIGISYGYWNRLKPKLENTVFRFKTINFEPLIFWGVIALSFLFAGLGFLLTIGTWQEFTVSEIPVVTYSNLVSLSFSIMGTYLIVFTIRQISARKTEKRKKKSI